MKKNTIYEYPNGFGLRMHNRKMQVVKNPVNPETVILEFKIVDGETTPAVHHIPIRSCGRISGISLTLEAAAGLYLLLSHYLDKFDKEEDQTTNP